ncbi:hypothetical protein B6U74_05160 [Candidatus Bathyarchaeota archaeon ex4484_205]|nr:MAG: hypothetical protein B6U74_05160 [Candidatus Bathyarchaeota archaeon ex4484_205]
MIARAEHPRPDFRRKIWLNLNGEWDFKKEGESEFRKIVVPYPPQSMLSKINDTTQYSKVFYKREFKVPSSFKEGRIFLHFGAVDYFTEVWLNGVKLGSHTGGYDPFSFEVTKLIKFNDNNRLELKVIDENKVGQAMGKQYITSPPSGVRYERVTGIWQTVWLELRGVSFLKGYRVYPKFSERGVEIKVDVEGDDECSMEVEVWLFDEKIWDTSLHFQKSHTFEVRPKPFLPWSPEQPDLYTIIFRIVKEGEVIDEVEGYFGIRSVEAKNGLFKLNEQPIRLALVLDQGYYPDGLYTPPSDEVLRRDVEIVKELGFNGVRKHQIVAEPRYYYWCDRIGLLVFEEMPDWGLILEEKYVRQFQKEIRNVIERDFNHPSVIAWTPFNEKTEHYRDKLKQRLMDETYELIKKIDPTRPVNINSGYVITKTDIVDIHEYGPTEKIREMWIEKFSGELPCSHNPVFAEGYRYNGQPIILGEVGGRASEDIKPIVDRPIFRHGGALKDIYHLLSYYRRLIEVIGSIYQVTGFCYTQLYDVEGEVNGFLTYNREYKIDPELIREINRKYLEKPSSSTIDVLI